MHENQDTASMTNGMLVSGTVARASASRAAIRVLLATAISITTLAACSDSTEAPTGTTATASLAAGRASSAPSAHDAHGKRGLGDLTPAQKQAIAQVRNATARFHDIKVAEAAGYEVQYPEGCAESPEGAQAYHYLNPGLVDDKVELLRPELLMYEPKPDGTLQLIGVDYVVPLGMSADAPTLIGVPFMENAPLDVWALHIWAWRPNPSGMFAAWNPKVSCQHAF